jgi:uncharacterized protein YcnI
MGMTQSAAAHNVLNVWEGPAGQLFPMKLNVNHGCKGSPVVGLRLQIPDGVVDAKAGHSEHWTVENEMRQLDEPIMMHGRPVTEVVSEIVWTKKEGSVPADGWAEFDFRMTLPDKPGEIIYFKNITVCEDGTDGYIDMPEMVLDVSDPEFPAKAWAFMTATPHPSSFLILRRAAKKQYPWEWSPEEAVGGPEIAMPE